MAHPVSLFSWAPRSSECNVILNCSTRIGLVFYVFFSVFQFSYFFILFNVYLFLRERHTDRQSTSGGGAEREGDTDSEAGPRL